MSKVFCIGNAESRVGFDLEKLRRFGKIYGCNAIYRDFMPDVLTAVDNGIIHEIYHAMDAKRYGWKKFKEMYEYEMNLQIANDKDEYKDNKYEIAAEDFGQKNWKKWFNIFKKQGLF